MLPRKSRFSTSQAGCATVLNKAKAIHDRDLANGWDRNASPPPEYETSWWFWEEAGWVNLGRTKNPDWMHVQAAKR
jgi:hypothetical protein